MLQLWVDRKGVRPELHLIDAWRMNAFLARIVMGNRYSDSSMLML